MAERHYGFRFSLPEGCVILLGLLLTSFLIFVFGVYVGKEVEAHKTAQQARTMRLPTSTSAEPQKSRPALDTAVGVSPTPIEKPVTISPIPNSLASAVPPESPPTPGSTGGNTLPSLPSATSQAVVTEQSKPGSLPSPSSTGSSKPSLPSSPPTSSPPTSSALASPPAKVPVVPKPPSPVSSPKPAPASPVPKPPSPANSATAEAGSPNVPSAMPPGSEFSDARAPAVEQSPAPKEKKVQVPAGRWAVQVQATTQEEAAQNLAKQLREQGLAPIVSKVERQGEVWYRVRVGKFANEEEARAAVSRFRREGKFSQAYPVLE